MFRSGLLVLLLLGFAFGGAAIAESGFNSHFRDYLQCGNSHFLNKGRESTASFDEIEITVKATCGHHVNRMRQALNRDGLDDRRKQNELINTLYEKAAVKFALFYRDGQIEVELRDEEARRMQEWARCLKVFAATVATTTDEKAELIADAAMASCRLEELNLFDLDQRYSPAMQKFRTEELYPDAMKEMRLHAISAALQARAAQKLQ